MPSLYRTLLSTATLLSIATIPPPVWAHGGASLDARFEVRQRTVDAFVRLTIRDLRHMVRVDLDDNGRLTPEEIGTARTSVEGYLKRTLLLEVEPQGESCDQSLQGYKLADFSSIDIHLRFRCPIEGVGFGLHSGLFGGTNHGYTLRARFVAGEMEQTAVLSRRHNRASILLAPAPNRSGLATQLLVGLALVALAVAAAVLIWSRRQKRSAR
jgi:hypothetical protein